MTGFLAHLVVTAALLLVVAYLVPGMKVTGALAALLGAFVLGIVNAVVWPIAVVLTLPLTIVTFGLFLLVLNAAMLKLTAALVPGFQVRGFLPAVLGSVLLTVLNLGVEAWLGPEW